MTNSLLVERIEGILELRGLRNREIPGVGHAIELALQQPCPVPCSEKVKDCVSTNENGAESRRLYMPTDVGVGYSLMPSIAPTRVSVGVRYSMASVPKEQPRAGESLVERPARQRHALRLAVDQQRQILEQRRVPDAAVPVAARASPARSAPARRQRLRELLAGIERIGELARAVRPAAPSRALVTAARSPPRAGR